jgi:hypothetical protein
MLSTSIEMTPELMELFTTSVPAGYIATVVTVDHDDSQRVRGFHEVHEAVHEYAREILRAIYPFSNIKFVVCFIKENRDADEVKHVFHAGTFAIAGEFDMADMDKATGVEQTFQIGD